MGFFENYFKNKRRPLSQRRVPHPLPFSTSCPSSSSILSFFWPVRSLYLPLFPSPHVWQLLSLFSFSFFFLSPLPAYHRFTCHQWPTGISPTLLPIIRLSVRPNLTISWITSCCKSSIKIVDQPNLQYDFSVVWCPNPATLAPSSSIFHKLSNGTNIVSRKLVVLQWDRG